MTQLILPQAMLFHYQERVLLIVSIRHSDLLLIIVLLSSLLVWVRLKCFNEEPKKHKAASHKLSDEVCVCVLFSCSLMSGLARVHLSCAQPISLQPHNIRSHRWCIHSSQQLKKQGGKEISTEGTRAWVFACVRGFFSPLYAISYTGKSTCTSRWVYHTTQKAQNPPSM